MKPKRSASDDTFVPSDLQDQPSWQAFRQQERTDILRVVLWLGVPQPMRRLWRCLQTGKQKGQLGNGVFVGLETGIGSHNEPLFFQYHTSCSVGGKVYYVNEWVKTSRSTPLPGLCTSGKILLFMTSLSLGENCPDVQRPGSGVVGLVLTHPLMWCSFFPPSITFHSEKNGPLWSINTSSMPFNGGSG